MLYQVHLKFKMLIFLRIIILQKVLCPIQLPTVVQAVPPVK